MTPVRSRPRAAAIGDTASMRSGAVTSCLLIACGGVASGCGFTTAFKPDGGEMTGDGGPCATPTFSSQLETCEVPSEDLRITTSTTYNTTTHQFEGAMPAQFTARMYGTKEKPVDALVAHNVSIGNGVNFRVTGQMPFAIVAGGTFTLEDGAVIDLSSGGAGALAICSTPASAGQGDPGGGGGGGGGGFGAGGGKGGVGNDGATSAAGGAGASSTGALGPIGGCRGSDGGDGVALGSGGQGGEGGGALYIVARVSIVLGNGILNAGGRGGRGGGMDGGGGGGGGGSGGMILLEAPMISGTSSVVIAANGGGGGEGGDENEDGMAGEDGLTASSRAQGGRLGAGNGADGGDGGSRGTPPGDPVTEVPSGGGGGGGGGVGHIRLKTLSPITFGTISPAATIEP